MDSRTASWIRVLAASLATMVAALFAVAGAGPASAAKKKATGPCPESNALDNFEPADHVSAHATVSDDLVTYTFMSLTDEDPVGGVPGLVKYCVYSSTRPEAIAVQATGADGASWISAAGIDNFAFMRPKGNKSNIPLDGTSTVMGTATWSEDPPTGSTLLLHINDAAACAELYGDAPDTCYVFPKSEPICNAGVGNTDAAYNAIPLDVEHCSPPSLGFESNQTNEFGDRVALDTTGGTHLVSLTVDFQSYGCSDSGHWNKGATEPCVTTPGETFQVPGGITARIYDPSDLSTPLAEVTVAPDIPYRPSADPVNCPEAGNQHPTDDIGSRWFDPLFGNCEYSLSVPITFTFPSGTTFTDGQEVVWTVQFDTSHEGYQPIIANLGPQPCNATAQGCGYDSLNVGAKSYDNAPYAGTDVIEDEVYWSHAGNGNVLAPATGWLGFRPLGAITLGP